MRVITTACTVALLAEQAFGHPTRLEHKAVDFNSFRLSTTSEYSNATHTTQSSIANDLVRRPTSYLDLATALLRQVAPDAEFRLVNDHYVGTNSIGHVNFKQTAHGLDIDNADFNVNVAKDGSIFSYGNSFYKGAIPSPSPLLKRDQHLGLSIATINAVAKPEESSEHYTIEGTSGAYQDPKARLVYLQTPENALSLTWRVETDLSHDWILSYIDASGNNAIHGVVNYVADASYQVYPWGINDPQSGSRVLETNPHDAAASEFTWQGTGTTTYTTTRGNNGIAQANYEGDSAYLDDYRPSEMTADFIYDFDPAWTSFKSYSNASVTQLFYTANLYHDLLYELGFNEAAGNFETDNNGAEGKGNDAVILNAQDGSGTNNANFATPVDGQAGRMRMYMWTKSTPQRDCSFDASVIIHEYTHGLSNRLTGGPANSNCLSALESGGMGEGWSDFMAIAIYMKTTDSRTIDYPMGPWVSNNPAGLLAYLYSTSLTINPLTYNSVNSQTEVHSIGTTWATILYEVMWNLIDKHGITSQRKPIFGADGVPTDGRFLSMKLVIDGMALQPCSPTFVQARDAVIDADKVLTGGSNACELWTAFAKRGLGQGAARGSGSSGRTESYIVPSGVC